MTDAPNAPERVSIEELLTHARWVRALALRLVGSEAEADDIEQKTWLAGMRSPPIARPAIRSWLATVVNRLAIESRRSRRSLKSREEAVARPEAAGDSTEAVARVESQRKVVDLVMELPQPYRRCILLRYFESLPPREIAKRLGEPIETIHSRIQRAHAMLRKKLAEREGDAWPLALAPLVAWPAHPEPRGRWTPLVRAGAIVAGVVVLAVGAWIYASSAAQAPGEASDANASPRRSSDLHAPDRGFRSDRAETAIQAGDRAPSSPSVADATASSEGALGASHEITVVLVGRIESVAGPSDPIGGITLTATPLASDASRLSGTRRKIEVAGSEYRVDLPLRDETWQISEWELSIDDPAFLPESVRVLAPTAHREGHPIQVPTIRLRRAGFATGTVVWNTTVEGSVSWVGTFTIDGNRATKVEASEVRQGGRFRLRAPAGARVLLAAAGDDFVPVVRDVVAAAGGENDVGVISLVPGLRIAGHAEIPGGSIPSVTVWPTQPLGLILRLDKHYITYAGGNAWRYGGEFPVRSDGGFVAGGFSRGAFRVEPVASSPAASDLRAAAAKVVEASNENVELVIDGGRVRVLVRQGGRGVSGATVSASPTKGVPTRMVTDGNGEAVFVGLPGSTYRLLVEAKAQGLSGREETIVAPDRGRAVTCTVDLPAASTATWVVTLDAPTGNRPAIAGFGLYRYVDGVLGRTPEVIANVKAVDGRFRVETVLSGRFHVEIRPGCEWREVSGFLTADGVDVEFEAGRETTARVAVAPGGRLVVTARTADKRIATSCTCSVRDSSGRDVNVWFAARDASGLRETVRDLSPFGPTDVYPALPPGKYTIECELSAHPARPRKAVQFEIRAGEVTKVEVDFDPL